MSLRHPFAGHGNLSIPGLFARAKVEIVAPSDRDAYGRKVVNCLRGGPVYLDEYADRDGRFHIAYVGLADDFEGALTLAATEAEERGVSTDHILFSIGKAA